MDPNSSSMSMGSPYPPPDSIQLQQRHPFPKEDDKTNDFTKQTASDFDFDSRTSHDKGSVESYRKSSFGTRVLDVFRSYKLAPDNDNTDVKNSEDFLKPRHLQMIAIGVCIGTGLYVAVGKSLKNSGPGSVMINFILLTSMILPLIICLGELCCVFPNQPSIAMYPGRFCSENLGFAASWLYFLFWLTTLPSEISAATEVVGFWKSQHANTAVWVTVFLAYVVLVNAMGAAGYGETEFFSSFLKVLSIIIFFFVSIIINCGAAPKGSYIGAKYWHDPGAFKNGFKGFCSVFLASAYSLMGTENVGTAAGNTTNPQKAIPAAVKKVFYRVLFFYLITIFLITLVVPYNDPELGNVSPFIIAIQNSGIKVLPDIFNAIILVSILSVGNSAVFAASRSGIALVRQGWAPRFIGRVDQKGRPVISYLFSFAFACLSYVGAAPKGGVIFDWLSAVSGGGSFFVWGLTFLSHIRLRHAMKAQNVPDTILPYQFKGSLYMSYYGLLINFLALCTLVYISIFPLSHNPPNAYDFFVSFLGPAFFIVFLIISPFVVGFKYTPLKDIDLVTGRYDIVGMKSFRADSNNAEIEQKDKDSNVVFEAQNSDPEKFAGAFQNSPPKRGIFNRIYNIMC
ncbi:APC amino acid transporter [Schizosaccharomyces cryophilus OY26]|uniref:APC amino acid transporter n=1 Tax=Schizosaccharomyces cryophilus (strain OY26 / ATCC MYA-4695 / CBS 11777 / NBRC 106824 / NRRL Y48691) TaxID=653667 RepID=S9VVT7_SCHCR|nr:APC amino acid transporter [Schizosaccharomyces cryophilus OY26]EPY50265.1 APC amino acid transporter [Schizosaccharomyces cryophilus OY26]